MKKSITIILSSILGAGVALLFLSLTLEFFAIDACLDSGGFYNYQLNLCMLGEEGSESPLLKPTETFTKFTFVLFLLFTIAFSFLFFKIITAVKKKLIYKKNIT